MGKRERERERNYAVFMSVCVRERVNERVCASVCAHDKEKGASVCEHVLGRARNYAR